MRKCAANHEIEHTPPAWLEAGRGFIFGSSVAVEEYGCLGGAVLCYVVKYSFIKVKDIVLTQL